ncbi:hypothetical protein [uncultured Paraglaciecola sp.]|nr:hypothetical protein [uncultured Paraglaciecola sp.]
MLHKTNGFPIKAFGNDGVWVALGNDGVWVALENDGHHHCHPCMLLAGI